MKLSNGEVDRCVASDQVIRIDASAGGRVRAKLQELIGANSFQVDVHADSMADIGTKAIEEELTPLDRRKLENFGRGMGEPFVTIEGLPEHPDLPSTPQMFHDDADVQFSDCLLLAAIRSARLQPVALAYENFGRLMRNVAPAATALNAVSSHGSKEPLEFHTDNSAEFEGQQRRGSPSPHFLCFVGMRNHDANGNPVPTGLLRVSDIVNQAGSKLLATIQQPIFKIMPGQSNTRDPISDIPLLERCARTNEWRLRFNANGTQTIGLNGRAQVATRELIELIDSMESQVVSMIVSPGRILMFDNYRVLHRRSSFDPGADLSQGRWLRRCFACRDLRNGRRVDPCHRPFVWK